MPTSRGYPALTGTDNVDVAGDLNALATAVDTDVATHEAAKTGVHGIPSMASGQGLLWNGTTWVATDLATQSELDTAKTDYELGFSDWKTLYTFRASQATSLVGGTKYLMPVAGSSTTLLTVVGTGTFGITAINLDPADHAAGARTVQMRTRARVATNAVAPGITLPFVVAPIATIGGTSSNPPTVATVGSNIGNSDANIPSGTGANTTAVAVNATPYTMPAVGSYVVLCAPSSSQAANSVFGAIVDLQYRMV